MEIKYEDLQEIVMCLGIATEAMENADFEFEDEEERDYYYNQLLRVQDALAKAERLI